MRKAMMLAAPLVLAGCQTWGPTWSEVTGQRWNYAIENRSYAGISRIDNVSTSPPMPYKMAPGPRTIGVEGLPWGGFRNGDIKEFPLNAEPCKRYYINAQHRNPIQPEWWPVVDYVEEIAGCKFVAAAK
jgi:hypothetical protein